MQTSFRKEKQQFSNKQAQTQNNSKPKNNLRKIVSTHLLDGIYEGFVNTSYQRDGFGIIQTDDFQTYLGFFRYNKPHGLGLIIYTDGAMVYGNFSCGKFEGIGLADNGYFIQIGTFRGPSLIGIGYEYNYQNRLWKMNKYHKGVAIEVIQEETLALEEGVPNFMTLEADILSIYLNFINKKYFCEGLIKKSQIEIKQDFNNIYVHSIHMDLYYFGLRVNDKFQGLGLLYNMQKRQVIEVGMYKYGKLDGFGTKIDIKIQFQQMGFFVQGRRQGIFYTRKGNGSKFSQYNKDTMTLDDIRGLKIETIRKEQKIHYYRQKDFLSLRHELDIHSFKQIFESSEYKAWKIQQQTEVKERKTPNKGRQQKKKHQRVPKDQNNTVNSTEEQQKSSVTIMKQKVYNLMSNKQSKKNDKKALALFNQTSQSLNETSYDRKNLDDDIALEQNPIKNTIGQSQFKTKGVSYKNYETFKRQ